MTLAATAALAASAALAAGASAGGAAGSAAGGAAPAAACAMSYAAFETLVPHLDLEECPASLAAPPEAFCRLAVSAETAHVFAFDPATDCLVASRAWEAGAFAVTLD